MSLPTPEPTAAINTESRKIDHIRINLEENVAFDKLTTGLERYFFIHQAVPEIDLAQVDTAVSLFNKTLRVPLLISSMTGGAAEAETINLQLAEAAQELGIAMGLGSQRAAIEAPALADTYRVRRAAPNILLFANLGAVQLNYGYRLADCQRAVDMVEADALILHFNALQEAVQPEGDGNFAGLLAKVEALCRALPVPVVAKEVGWGFSKDALADLTAAGVAAFDIAGAGGTSWSQVEMYRAPTPQRARIAKTFIDWGIPTAVSLQYARQIAPHLPAIASGGIRDGIDVAKSVALGATAVGIAGDFLRAADQNGVRGVVELGETIAAELRIAMFAAGAQNISALQETRLHTTYPD